MFDEDNRLDVRTERPEVETIPMSISGKLNNPLDAFSNEKVLPVTQLSLAPEREDVFSRLSKLYSAPPLRENIKPSKLRRAGGMIVGGLVGASQGAEAGSKAAMDIVDRPYREAYQDWSIRTGALGEEAKLGIEREKLNLEGQRIDNSGLSGYASYRRAIDAGDPDLQGDIERSRVSAREEALEPGREKDDERTRERNESLENTRQTNRMAVEAFRQTGRNALTDKEIKARDANTEKTIRSREYIAGKNRELREQMGLKRDQRIPPNQQYLAKIMAEKEVAELMSDSAEFNAIFTESKDSQNRPIITLKPDKEIKSNWTEQYRKRKKQIDDLAKGILAQSYSGYGQDEVDTSETEDEFDIEEVY